MDNLKIYNEWSKFIEEYKEYFLKEEIWKYKLNKVKEYINANNKRPSERDKDENIKYLGLWIHTQQINYETKNKIMSNPKIYNIWTKFIEIYNIWNYKLNRVIEYIETNNKRPSKMNKDKNIKSLGAWITHQTTYYKSKKGIMANLEIYNKWTEFIEKYKEYFISNEEEWMNNLNKVKEYIDTNNKRLSPINIDKNINLLYKWIQTQKQNYKIKKRIMANLKIYNEWTKFIEKYNKLNL